MLSKLKSLLFWSHLVAGVVAGIALFSLAATGVLLTYERQMVEWAERQYSVAPQPNRSGITTDEVVAALHRLAPEEHHIYVRWVNREGAAIPAWAGSQSFLLDPYTGDVLRTGAGAVATSFRFITDFHRWFALQGSAISVGRAITAYANLILLFLILSGLYLWIPRRFSWSVLKRRLLIRRTSNTQARYKNWHFAFGLWSAVPLFVISVTATIFYFPQANQALYGMFGESVPEREEHAEVNTLSYRNGSLEPLYLKAQRHAEQNGASDWYSMWLELGEVEGEARFFIDRSIGRRPEFAYSLYLDIERAEVVRVKRQTDWSAGDQAWDVARYLHSGEYFGVIGQTIAGLTSLLTCILVYSGFVLAWKRLVPASKKRCE
ncbi:PepSY-associated TM helix domain-containing protein [Lacimicrobium alkaliphilum]|uniref:PepSY domain-containing protein n=1 Tax=Lacimicrobium alkaliphilum TaxID=1526571 RepID=A0ABQ1R709_9ALTE|nr:PepSY-associated TM helix domain-containing protein [Lacimicrobium alkaliphilum]GGD60766.1 hypothetical protein GCM10011357_15100 [Lacimicrobium alkaliphilum]